MALQMRLMNPVDFLALVQEKLETGQNAEALRLVLAAKQSVSCKDTEDFTVDVEVESD